MSSFPPRPRLAGAPTTLALVAALAATSPALAQTFTTDVTIDGNLCVGTDCTSRESFGFDTIRLKANKGSSPAECRIGR